MAREAEAAVEARSERGSPGAEGGPGGQWEALRAAWQEWVRFLVRLVVEGQRTIVRHEATIARQQAELAEERAAVVRAEAATAVAQAKLAAAEAQLREARRSQFGQQSEAGPEGGTVAEPPAEPSQEAPAAEPEEPEEEPEEPAAAPDGPEEPPEEEPPKRKRGRQPGAPTPPRVDRSHLPRQREVWTPAPEDCRCPACDAPYVPNGGETSVLYEIEVEALARELFRQRMKPTCECAGARDVIAPRAPRLFARTQLGVSVWAWATVEVFEHARPQAAVARDLAAWGLRVPVGTLAGGLQRLQRLFEPVAEAIAARQTEAEVAQADETSWPVQEMAGPGKPKRWLWLCRALESVHILIHPKRSAVAAQELLGGLGEAGPVILVCDRWSAYKKLARLLPERFQLAYCWAHQRRDFRRVATGYPALRPWTEAWLERIGEVFHQAQLRREAWQPEGPPSAAYLAAHAALVAAVDAVFAAARQEAAELSAAARTAEGAAKSALDAQVRAVRSLLEHEQGLRVFLTDPRVPPDNNAAERALRRPVISRLTSFGSGSPAGAEMAAVFLTVYGTLRLQGLNPNTWTLAYLEACARQGGQPPPDLEAFLPWRLDAARRRELSGPPPTRRARDGPTSASDGTPRS